MAGSRRFLCISCNVFYREVCALVARSPHQIDITFLPKGLHSIGCVGMRERLQQKLDELETTDYEAVLWGYAMCNHGLVGIVARRLPLVIPRAHDCMTLFFGSSERYLKYFQENPGTYFQTPGWIEREESGEELDQLSITNRLGMNQSYAELVEKYGEDNAQYLYEELFSKMEAKGHGKITYIDTGVSDDEAFARRAQSKAEERGWEFDRQTGDLSMLHRLLNGDWNEREFLVVPPGHQVVATYDERMMRAEPVAS